MHLMLPFAAPRSEAGRQALATLALPTLERLLARWSTLHLDAGDEWSLSPPHERALARAWGLAGADGCLPWAAYQVAAAGVPTDDLAWGQLTPVHWQVGSEGVTLADPAQLALDAAESQSLFDTVKPLFEREGFVLVWGAPLSWWAAHESLRDLPTASADRAIGRHVDRWLPDRQRARALRQLLNEAQMLLHEEPVNAAREARGVAPVNALWLSGCGGHQRTQAVADLVVDERLRAPALGDDGDAWTQAWHAIDAGPLRQLMAAGGSARLTVCGDRCAVTLAPGVGLWRRLSAPWRRPHAAVWLADL